ncbi:putative xyloglucan endotransglucosylase/hydrolase protein 28 [Sesamum angolense]|uniref:Xyloglucan endotransglucosylase/hydrolase protein 28 n=1 Tax=Sesamum angolense TaxID=2727404 RepID=A0AAE1WV42_9LAMI|nr:putative xyloglucan endotransglucosylase/hydrolase protein 28 [Sesamum angolense]
MVSGFSRNLPILSFDEGFWICVTRPLPSWVFSASIKLPADYTAGVVVAFYMSNGDIYEKNHDEIDFEFLGNIRGKDWRIQTNIYGNGSTSIGRKKDMDSGLIL